MRKPTIPANLPPGAFGFIVTRPDRVDRLALYRADGSFWILLGARPVPPLEIPPFPTSTQEPKNV